MASEMIAEAITDYFGERCSEYDADCLCCKAWYEFDRLIHADRPAPAATDTGLVTAMYQYEHSDPISGRPVWHDRLTWNGQHPKSTRELVTRSQAGAIIAELQAKAKDYREYSERLEKRLEREEVTRSQAEELLAAERAEKERLADDYHAIREQLHRGWQEFKALKAENAAQAARIKELEARVSRDDEIFDKLIQLGGEADEKFEALEAKLAAAEKVKEAMRKAAVDYCWQRYKGRDPLSLKNPAVFTSHEWEKIGEAMDAAARAVLGGKPS